MEKTNLLCFSMRIAFKCKIQNKSIHSTMIFKILNRSISTYSCKTNRISTSSKYIIQVYQAILMILAVSLLGERLKEVLMQLMRIKDPYREQ